MNGAKAVDSPLALQAEKSDTALMVQAMGDGQAIQIFPSTEGKLAFLADGFAAFSKLSLGANAAPGAIEVTYSFDSALGVMRADAGPTVTASLDGGKPANLPHIFENVSAGPHKITIPEVWWQWKLYKGAAATVTVEPGTRAKFDGNLMNGKGTLEVTGIPKGSTVRIDSAEINNLIEGPDGNLGYHDVVFAGDSNLEITNGNKKWKGSVIVPIDGRGSLSVKEMHQYIILQSKTVALKGKDTDWDGVDPVFTGSGFNQTPKIGGSEIAGGSICRDAKYINIKMDFANGEPSFIRGSIRQLELFQGNKQVNLEVSVWDDGTIHSDIWVRSMNKLSPAGKYVVGKTFVEMQFRLSDFSRYFDLSQPIRGDLDFFLAPNWDSTHNKSPLVDILMDN